MSFLLKNHAPMYKYVEPWQHSPIAWFWCLRQQHVAWRQISSWPELADYPCCTPSQPLPLQQPVLEAYTNINRWDCYTTLTKITLINTYGTVFISLAHQLLMAIHGTVFTALANPLLMSVHGTWCWLLLCIFLSSSPFCLLQYSCHLYNSYPTDKHTFQYMGHVVTNEVNTLYKKINKNPLKTIFLSMSQLSFKVVPSGWYFAFSLNFSI